jgi:hypothetical protein
MKRPPEVSRIEGNGRASVKLTVSAISYPYSIAMKLSDGDRIDSADSEVLQVRGHADVVYSFLDIPFQKKLVYIVGRDQKGQIAVVDDDG